MTRLITGLVIERNDGAKTIITSCDMIDFTEAFVKTVVKSTKMYIILIEK